MTNKINFSKFFNVANIFSVLVVLISILFLFFKGLNYGVDFKGGTLLEIRIENKNIQIQEIRSALNISELGDVNVKEFGKEGDFLIKFEMNANKNKKFIADLKSIISKKINTGVNFRRVETVGPKVSSELLEQGVIAIALALGAMLF
jgi:preprotein translocase subunit SecF